MFYTYYQNNSGGGFQEDKHLGIDQFVIIEANTMRESKKRAESIGLYFDGVIEGIDCACCGDRWTAPDDSESPEVYCSPVYFGPVDPAIRSRKVFVHYLDGSIKEGWFNYE